MNFSFTNLRLSVALFALCVAATAASAQASSDWKKFVSTSDGFSVIFPAAPAREDLGSPQGVDQKGSTYSSQLNGITYLVIAAEVQGVDWNVSANRDAFARGMTKGTCASSISGGVRCEVKETGETRYKGNVAREFSVVMEDLTVGSGLIVFAGKRVYTMMASGLELSKNSELVKKFLDSFEASPK
jgi:hypothetical protein